MRVLIGCETSGVIRRAFEKCGHDAWSCDLLESKDKSKKHIVSDVRRVIIKNSWDLFIVHPDCQYLCSSGMHWTTRGYRDPQLTVDALKFAIEMIESDVPRVCAENPHGHISTHYRKYDQVIQPNQFGDDASKATCLWLRELPPLIPTQQIEPRIVYKNGKAYKRWANQTDSGQNKLGPSDDRWQKRAETYPGIADAMALQWGCL